MIYTRNEYSISSNRTFNGASSGSQSRAIYQHNSDNTKKIIDDQILRKIAKGQAPLVILPTFGKDMAYRLYRSYDGSEKGQSLMIAQLQYWLLVGSDCYILHLSRCLTDIQNDATKVTKAAMVNTGIGSGDLNGSFIGQVSCGGQAGALANCYHCSFSAGSRGNCLTLFYVFYSPDGRRYVARVIGVGEHNRGNNVGNTKYNILRWDPNYTITRFNVELAQNSRQTTLGGGNGLSGQGKYFA
jgi:hypothetical protein